MMTTDKAEVNDVHQEYVPLTMQQMINAGLNAFAVKLVAESIEQNDVIETVKFRYGRVGITIEPLSTTE